MILFSCRRAAELTSKELDARLAPGERVGLAAHRAVCAHCRRYRDQLARVDRAVAELLAAADPAGDGLSDEAKGRMRQALRAAGGGP